MESSNYPWGGGLLAACPIGRPKGALRGCGHRQRCQYQLLPDNHLWMITPSSSYRLLFGSQQQTS